MKIMLRSANLIDLITSQGSVRFLATHTQSHLGDPGILKNKETLDFPFYFLIITRSLLKCCLPPKEFKNFRALSVSQIRVARRSVCRHCCIAPYNIVFE